MVDKDENRHDNIGGQNRKQMDIKNYHKRDDPQVSELWTDGLICAFEYIRGSRFSSTDKSGRRINPFNESELHTHKKQAYKFGTRMVSNGIFGQKSFLENFPLVGLTSPTWISGDNAIDLPDGIIKKASDYHWVPIGWSRISELVEMVQTDDSWASQKMEFADEEGDLTVADIAAPYWEQAGGPTWWCHVLPGHSSVDLWLINAHWLHPAVSVALRDESRLISDRMKHLLYEVPVRVAGGLLFELLGQSVGDPYRDEDDIPIVLRSWQSQNFLITSMHIKGHASNINVLGITEVQELLLSGGYSAPKSVREVIAHLASRLSRWDDRLFRKYVFGAADEIELKFVNRRNYEDLTLLSVILNQEIKRLATQVIRVKWSLHAREEIIFELLQHLRGSTASNLLEGIRKSTREMLEEQEAVRDRLFTVQDVMQSTVRAWLQDRSLRVTHNLAVFGGGGLVLSVITSLFGINVDGIPGAANTPYAFVLFTGILALMGIILVGAGILYLGMRNPIDEEKIQIRKVELQQLISMFKHDAETHAKVMDRDLTEHKRHNLSPTAADFIGDTEYVLIP